MAAMIGLQLRWPIVGSARMPFLVRTGSVQSAAGSEEDMLVRYTERFFAATLRSHDLREMPQLTAAVCDPIASRCRFAAR